MKSPMIKDKKILLIPAVPILLLLLLFCWEFGYRPAQLTSRFLTTLAADTQTPDPDSYALHYRDYFTERGYQQALERRTFSAIWAEFHSGTKDTKTSADSRPAPDGSGSAAGSSGITVADLTLTPLNRSLQSVELYAEFSCVSPTGDAVPLLAKIKWIREDHRWKIDYLDL